MTILFHYPNCSTSKQAQKFLDTYEIDYTLRNLTEDKLNEEELRDLVKRSGLTIDKFLNTSGKVYRSLNLKEKKHHLSFEDKIALLAENPMLIKRPILVHQDTVLVGYKDSIYHQLFTE